MRWFWIAAVFLLVACDRGPELGRLSKDQWSQVILDLHLLEILIVKYPETTRDSIRQSYLDEIVKVHGLTEEELRTVFVEMQRHPLQSVEIYDKALAQLKTMLDSLDHGN